MANHRQPVPDWLNESYMETTLRNYLNDPGLKVLKVSVNPGSAEGDNYIGQIFRISTDFESSKIEERNISVIGKLKTDSKLVDDFADNVDLFHVEAQFFSTLQTKLNRILREKGGVIFSPKGVRVDLSNNIIMMEDLRSANFQLQPRGQLLNLKQAELAIDAFANLHAASLYAMEEDPKLRDNFRGHVFSSIRTPGMDIITKNAMKALSDNIHKYTISKTWKDRLLGLQKKLDNDWFKIYEPCEGNLNVLLHGDCWLNNMMFHYLDDEPDQVILIDYQIVNYSSFALDLMHFLFSSVQSDILLSKIDYFLQRYYSNLVKIASDFPDISLDRIRSEFKEKFYFGFLAMILIRPMILSDNPPDFDLIIQGQKHDLGYNNAQFIEDVEKLLPIFENLDIW